MIKFPSFPHRKIFLTALVLVSISVTVLVAQNTPPKEAAPAGTGQGQIEVSTQDAKFQTYTGEEYVVYLKGDTYFFYDPATGKESPNVLPRDLWEIKYQGNLGKPVTTKQRTVSLPSLQGEGLPDEVITSVLETKQVGSNGNIIITGIGQPPVVSVAGFPDFVLKGEKRVSLHIGEYDINVIPLGWIDRTHLLVVKGSLNEPHQGIFSIDIAIGTQKEILPGWESKEGRTTKQYYVELPNLSPSGRYLLYQKPIGIWSSHDGGKTELILYDLITGTKKKIADDGYPMWFTTKEVSQGPGEPGFFSSVLACDQPTCGGEGMTFKLPFKCGEVYRVTRDGECFTPAECNYGDGGYPIATWNQSSSQHHAGKKAIDFSDNYVGGTGSNDMPVLAAQAGTVTENKWGDTYGWSIWIQHSDGKYTGYFHFKVQSPLAIGTPVTQGQTIGTEGCTGSECDGQHIHFVRSTAMTGAGPNSRWMNFAELGLYQVPTDEHVYISQNGSCSGNCNVTGLSSCGGTWTGQSNVNIANTRATYFSKMTSVGSGNAASQDESAGEKLYSITMNQIGGFKVELQNVAYQVGSDLDVFIAKIPSGQCSNFDPLKDFKDANNNFICNSTGVTSQTESATAPSGTYHIIVDGVANSQATYNLKVTPCPDITDNGSSKSTSGRQVTITAKIKNAGCGNFNAQMFYTRFVLSADINLGNDYFLVDLQYTGNWSIAPNGTNSYTFTWTVPNSVPAGWYYLIETLDHGNAVCEANENNSWYFGGSFYVPPAFTGGADDRSEIVGAVEVPPVAIEFDTQTDMSNVVQISQGVTQGSPVQATCTATVNGFHISTSPVTEGSTYQMANRLGQIVCSGKASDNTVECEVFTSGIYFLTIIDGAGNKCSQKIFVN